jgi:hypothetical protein
MLVIFALVEHYNYAVLLPEFGTSITEFTPICNSPFAKPLDLEFVG